MSNRSLGMGDQLSLPATQRSHNLEGLVASPAKRQLIPTIAIGNSFCDADVGTVPDEELETRFPLVKECGWSIGINRKSECTTILVFN